MSEMLQKLKGVVDASKNITNVKTEKGRDSKEESGKG